MAKKISNKPTKVAKKTTIKPAGAKTAPKSPSRTAAKPKLLSGGNPQIAKAYGDAPVQAYIAAMPGWKSEVGRRLDALITRTVPDVHKAVKWNSPLYGIEDQGWFLGIHCFTKYIKVAFFRGALLRPQPPGESKQKYVRYLHIYEDDALDEAQLAAWVKEASRVHAPHLEVGVASKFNGYGYQTWLIRKDQPYFALFGVRGQGIYIDPVSKLVIVHTAVFAGPRDSRAPQFELFFKTLKTLTAQ